MINWMNRKGICSRCFSGIDDDHDGNCPACANMDDKKAAWMKRTRFNMEMAGKLNMEE